MEELLNTLLQRISEKMPELSLVDEDYGQLDFINDDSEDMYPVTFPCVLVGNTEIEWKRIAPGTQKGSAAITVKLAIDCYDDTHIGSGTTGMITERQEMSNRVYKALQEFRLNKFSGPLNRIKSRDYSIPGNIKVYEKIFSFEYHDESAR